MNELQLIASRIRRWREDANFTLQDLADRSGVSPSTIHKVENNQTVPTLTVFLKIAEGLDRDASDLLAHDTGLHRVAVTKAQERSTLVDRSGTRVQKIVQNYRNPHIEMWRAIVQPGVAEEQSVAEDDGELIFLCERGRLEMTIDGRDFALLSGDAIHCCAATTRFWRNEGSIPAVVTLCMDLPPRVLPREVDRIRHVVGKSVV